MKQDIKRLQEWYSSLGYELNEKQCYDIWKDFSNENYSATWLDINYKFVTESIEDGFVDKYIKHQTQFTKDKILDYLKERLKEEKNRNDFGYDKQYELDKAKQNGAIYILEEVIDYIKRM